MPSYVPIVMYGLRLFIVVLTPWGAYARYYSGPVGSIAHICAHGSLPALTSFLLRARHQSSQERSHIYAFGTFPYFLGRTRGSRLPLCDVDIAHASFTQKRSSSDMIFGQNITEAFKLLQAS